MAASKGFNNILICLYNHGADLNLPDGKQWSPLMYASFNCRILTINLFH